MKKKILNDPVYGFISIAGEKIFKVVEHPIFQRLRRIKQLGLTDYVYLGALHTRFHHALGAMHLMSVTLDTLKSKGHFIADEEYEAAQLAILLHDIGHGPFSHALETTILSNAHHEDLSLLFMQYLNKELGGGLEMAIQIFEGTYPKKFLHQLITSQLDIDRLDYLNRDSFFTGVSEGTVGAERIIKMLDVRDNKIVVEEKGIYSVENFLNSRRLMYWQVYLHKTSISAEEMLIQLIKRAKHLLSVQIEVFASESLKIFINQTIGIEDFRKNTSYIDHFCKLDDYDIWGAIKVWQSHPDKILSTLSKNLLDRKLLKIAISNKPFGQSVLEDLYQQCSTQLNIQLDEAAYFCMKGEISNAAYIKNNKNINILTKSGDLIDIAEASDLPNIKALSNIVKKYYIAWPKGLVFNNN